MGQINCDIFIPVRLDSTRLPKKHLKTINNKPALKHLIDRLRQCKKIRHIIVCTTELSSDDELVLFLKQENILFFRGNEKDILQRFLDAAEKFDTDIIIDVEGDKIFTDSDYVDQIASLLTDSQIDFIIGNDHPQNFNPSNHFVHGLIPAGFTKNSLEKICTLKTSKNTETGYREFFINSDIFKTKFLLLNENVPKNLRLTLDYEEDLHFADIVFSALGTYFSKNDLLDFLNKKPEILDITKDVHDMWEKNYENNKVNLELKNENN